MPDGRMHKHAHMTALALTTLTTVGLGLATTSPATAAPDHRGIDALQVKVDRLTHQAGAAQKRHDQAQTSLTGARRQIGVLSTQLQRQRRVMENLRAQVAGAVVGDYDGAGGASAPARSLSTGSMVLLTNVSMVSEDTGVRGEAMSRTNATLQQLNNRRSAVRSQVTALSGLETRLRTQQRQVDLRAARAGATLDRLQEQAEAAQMKAMGGPVLAYAKSQIGKAYVYGAAGPNSFDCSGLTMMAWAQSGVSLPHSSSAQSASGRHISESELQPGDLVFYYSPISHVGLYIGNGQIVNALNPGAGVRISGLHDMPYSGAVRPG